MVVANKLFNTLLASLTSRQKEVIQGRFALGNASEPKTLAAIGDKFGVSRERIRQIEAAALKLISAEIKPNSVYAEILERGKKHLDASGGISGEEQLVGELKKVANGINRNHLDLLLAATNAFYGYPEDGGFLPFYYAKKADLAGAVGFLNKWTVRLNEQKNNILSGGYNQEFAGFVKQCGIKPAIAENYVGISKNIRDNAYGDAGLTDWPEINPRTIRDKIYLVMKKHGQPLHFRGIADGINKAGIDGRKALVATVHNELIRDNRFVLIGRGIYALSENGYTPGNAREIIHKVLKQKPMHLPEVVMAVQKERILKPNTILINLQNKSFFEKLPDGKYKVREA